MTTPGSQFSFEISLSTLNHLGRQLYRSFATVLGEAISNAWDADASSVWIYTEPGKTSFWIKDDGVGMTAEDFQAKFLRIGYSKRRDGTSKSPRGRPYVGRKGIGKLALLSCADRISVLSRVDGGSYVGGVIDNAQLDKAIIDDLTPQQYALGIVAEAQFAKYVSGHTHGTIIRFEGVKDGPRRSFAFLREVIALYFRFSLLDEGFRVFVNDTQVTHEDLAKLSEKTQFLWRIGSYHDPFLTALEATFATDPDSHESRSFDLAGATGFLASVKLPKDLKIASMDERIGVDLFVNGRLRERDILKHVPTAQVPESYLYGQVHFNALDDDTDRFTSSREGIVADDPLFTAFLADFRKMLLKVVEEWDDWRRAHRDDGDPENPKVSKARRASAGLYNAVTQQFAPTGKSIEARKVEKWVNDLRDDAAFNFESYAECFVSENLIRKYIVDRSIPMSPEALKQAARWRATEADNKNKGNISIDIRQDGADLGYLDMDDLANLADKPTDKLKQAALARDASEFKPMRDAVAHTALLTQAAKGRLGAVQENIKARIKALLGQPPEKKS